MTQGTRLGVKVAVRFFALYRERAGRTSMPLELPKNSTVGDLIAHVRNIFPLLAPPDVDIVAAVNAEYVEGDRVLNQGDEVALIPPVSGGQP